ncbi:MAG TPA: 3'-5' exonuclease, partial [Marinilabiliaceae bacterium]|nr:3'-5' exonuclease [Marinilabiliaceae bacterium]
LWEQYKAELFTYQQKPLYELIEAVSSLIPADLYTQHAIFIQGFLSVALSFINEETADINQFIAFWHNRGSRLSLSVPNDQEAIRVMTIHKSKGLEFEAVVIPFVDWKINSLKHSNFLWLKPKAEPFNAVSLVPINGVNAVALSHFADDFFDETLLNYVDTLNVGYVAFTRAKRSISLIGYVAKKNFKKIDNFSNLMLQFVSSSVSQENYPKAWDEEMQFFEFGQILPATLDTAPKEAALRKTVSVLSPEIKHTPIHSRINNHLESYHSFDGSHQNQQLHHGKIMHQLFELIKDEKDVDSALFQLRLQGIISVKEIEPLKREIAQYINHPKAKNWFNNYYQIKTEATILAKNSKRPDRVMIGDDEIIVVDYKFGHEKSAKHHAQVRQYLNLVQQIANKKALGYLWYMESNEIIEVDMQGRLF